MTKEGPGNNYEHLSLEHNERDSSEISVWVCTRNIV